MSDLVVCVVEGVLGAKQAGSMSAARPIGAGILLYTSLVEAGHRLGLLSCEPESAVQRFLDGNRIRGQSWRRFGEDSLEAAIVELQQQAIPITLILTPRKLAVERVAQCVLSEWIDADDPLLVEGVSQRRRPDWADMFATAVDDTV